MNNEQKWIVKLAKDDVVLAVLAIECGNTEHALHLLKNVVMAQLKALEHEPDTDALVMEVKVSDERIEDVLCCAFEGGSNHWYFIKSFNYPKGETKESLDIEYQHTQLPLKGGSLTIVDLEGEMPEEYVLDREALNRGLNLMAEKYPKDFADIVNENEDADTGDIYLQLCLFGDVVFG